MKLQRIEMFNPMKLNGKMNKGHKYLAVFSVATIIIIAIIIGSQTARNNRFDNLNSEFKESEFSGVVTMITQDKLDHNSWKIYFDKNNNSLDLTWFENKTELINRIHIGDSISKPKNGEIIHVFSKTKAFGIKVIILK